MKQRAVFSCALLALLLGLAGPGCVRLDEPETFVCDDDIDCLAGEHCGSQRHCLEADRCEVADDCASSETCYQAWCVTAQCLTVFDTVCGAYSCNPSERICHASCEFNDHCFDGYTCDNKVCRTLTVLANGSVCTTHQECASKACCTVAGTRICSTTC